MIDHKGLMNEPSSKYYDYPYHRNPKSKVADILDDSFIPTDEQVAYGGSDYLWTDTDTDWCKVATDRAATIIRQTQELEHTSRALRESLIQRDIWWPLGFGAGVLCGLGLAVLW